MFLKELTELSGVSGCEYEVRNYIKSKLDDIGCEYYVDKIGNIIAHNKGTKGTKKIMIAAHMDEVGLIVTGIDSYGFLKFKEVGGVDQRVLNSKAVKVGLNKISGVIGSAPVHLMTADERGKSLETDKLYIDIGTNSKEETEKLINIGDYVAFKSDYTEFGDSMIKAKALDDRAGCSAILELLSMNTDVDFYGAFTVMEEVGLRGAYTAAYGISPEIAVVLEGTVSADMPEIEEHSKVTTIGKGTAVSLMDGATVYNIDFVRHYVKLAKEQGILCQYRKSSAGSNDSGPIHLSKGGCKVIALALPCRYIHSSVSVGNKNDYNSMVKFAKMILDDNK